jgi:hypothetical protein
MHQVILQEYIAPRRYHHRLCVGYADRNNKCGCWLGGGGVLMAKGNAVHASPPASIQFSIN